MQLLEDVQEIILSKARHSLGTAQQVFWLILADYIRLCLIDMYLTLLLVLLHHLGQDYSHISRSDNVILNITLSKFSKVVVFFKFGE